MSTPPVTSPEPEPDPAVRGRPVLDRVRDFLLGYPQRPDESEGREHRPV